MSNVKWSYNVTVWEDAGYYKTTSAFPGPFDDRPYFATEEAARDAMNELIATLPAKYTVHAKDVMAFSPVQWRDMPMMYESTGRRITE